MQLSAAPTNEIDKNRLLGDKNAWIGIPIGIVTSEEAKKPVPAKLQLFKDTSPYNAAVVKHDPSINAPKRLTGLQTLYALGWKNPIEEARIEDKKNRATGGAIQGGGVHVFAPAPRELAQESPTRGRKTATMTTHPTHPSGNRSSDQSVSNTSPNKHVVYGETRATRSPPPRTKTASANPRVLAQTRVSTAEREARRGQGKDSGLGIMEGLYDTATIDRPFTTSNFGSDQYNSGLSYQYSALTTGLVSGPASGGNAGGKVIGAYPAIASLPSSPDLNASATSFGSPLHTAGVKSLFNEHFSSATSTSVGGSRLALGSGSFGASGVHAGVGSGVSGVQRGAIKPTMGRPTTVGSITEELATGKRSIQAIARAQEKHLLHLTQDPGMEHDMSSAHHDHDHAARSVGGNSFFSTSDHTTNSPRPKGKQSGGSVYEPNTSAWSKLRSDVSTLTGHSKKSKGTFDGTWSGTLHGMESMGMGSSVGRNGDHTATSPTKKARDYDKPWGVRTTTHFKMRYSWMAQPMLQEAAGQVYQDEMLQKRQREAAELARKNAKKKKVPFLQRLKNYNASDVSTVSSLTELRNFQKVTSLSIRDERLRADPLHHPYPWA
jgi:hypothetical protein